MKDDSTDAEDVASDDVELSDEDLEVASGGTRSSGTDSGGHEVSPPITQHGSSDAPMW